MNSRNMIALIVVALLTLSTTVFAQPYDYETMKMDEYETLLAQWQEKLANAKAGIETTQADIESLKAEIAKVEEEDNQVWQEIYALVESDEAGVKDFMANLDNVEAEIDGLANLSPDDLYTRRAEIDDLEAKLEELKQSKIAVLSQAQDKIAEIEGKIAGLRSTLERARKWDEYVVVRGDYLWKIAKGQYDDPYQWIRIYTKNTDLIKDPDLIYPDWNLKIQRKLENNEYLVAKGDYLKLIAGNVLGDPTAWKDIHEANKDVMEKLNADKESKTMLYPNQILIIPGK